ncbi:MAG: beta-propeller domain-containing protein [Nitrososphaerales archaeon]|jgi:uncharacterized secreted protein with C-terminal beta-propeller domain
MQRRNKAFLSVLTLTVLVLAAFAAIAPYPQRQVGLSGSLLSFESYDQMKSFASQNQGGYQKNIVTYMPEYRTAAASLSSPSASTSYTTTNIQVEGVDEADLVKTDGSYLYVASGTTVSVIRAGPLNATALVAKLKFDGTVLGLFIAQGRLVVLETNQRSVNSNYVWYSPVVNFMLYDDANASAPVLLKTVSLNGTYVDSRLASGFVYAVVQQPTYVYVSGGNSSFVAPSVTDGNKTTKIDPADVFYSPSSTSSFGQYTIILSLSVADGAHTQEAVMTGWGSTVYASNSNIYLAFPDFYAYPMMGVMRPATGTTFGAPLFWRGFGGNTTIFRVAMTGSGQTQVQAEGMIPGTVLNQFSIDEYNGYLRVATTSYRQLANQSSVQVNNVYVLDQSMKVVGAVENMAPTERIYSVRFLGDTGYVVTYERIDPFFAISFSDPTHPIILSSLELTGFSDYLHPIGSGLLLGVGKQTIPAPQEEGYVIYLGVKLTIFHVLPDGSSTVVANMTIGDRGSDTPVSSDHHSFVYDAQDGIVAFPILVAKTDNRTSGGAIFPSYGNPVYQGAFFFNVSQTGIKLIGSVTQVPEGSPIDQNQDFYVNRIVIIGGYAYTISNRMVMVSNLSNFSFVGAVKL